MEPPITNNQSPATGSDSPVTNHQSPDDDEISLLDLAIVLAKHKWLILGLPFVTAIVAVTYALMLPIIYTATTKIFVPQTQSATSVIASQIGGLGAMAGGLAGMRNPNDLYVALLRSRTVADNLVQRFDLMRSTNTKYRSRARKVLADVTNITSGKGGVISIDVEDEDPKRAAELANAYVDELFKITSVLAVTEASQRRLFYERQFAQARDNLTKAEVAAREALQHGGLVKVDDQGKAMVETTARLRAQITVKEVQIGAMRSFAADRNPDLRLVQQELQSMKRELAKIEGTDDAKAMESASSGKGLGNLRLLRDMKYYETIYELLARQYEMAKIDEAREGSVIQVIDIAIQPDLKSGPKRAQIVLISVILALFGGALLAFIREAMAKGRGDPKQARRLQALKRYILAWR